MSAASIIIIICGGVAWFTYRRIKQFPIIAIQGAFLIGFKNKYDLPVVKSKCPVDGYTKRQYAKELVRQLNTEHPGAKERMFRAILNGDIKGWPERILQTR